MFGSFFGPKDDFVGAYERGAIVVDVRTPQEFNDGHFPKSVNIPLDQVPSKLDFFKSADKEIILVCRSGGRAGSAKGFLKKNGIDCMNGGGWESFQMSVN